MASPWDDLGALGSTTKDTLRSRLGFSSIFDGFRDPILKASRVPWIKKSVFLHAGFLFFLFLKVLGSESGCLELENQVFCMGGIAKINFRRSWISYDLQGLFLMICRVHFLRVNFHDFCCPEDWLEIR